MSPATRFLLTTSGVALGAALLLEFAGRPALAVLAIVAAVAAVLTLLRNLLDREPRR